MPVLTSDQTMIADGETNTGWSGDTFILDPAMFVEGSNSVSCAQTIQGDNLATFTPTAAIDLTGQTLRIGLNSGNVSIFGDTMDNGGMQVILTHTNGVATHNVGGNDTYSGGWGDLFFDVHRTPEEGVAYTTGTVSIISLNLYNVTKPKNVINCWLDNWRYGDGYAVTSVTTEEVSLLDVADTDKLTTNAYGILSLYKGVLFGTGKITFGGTGTENCNLVSAGETLYFEDAYVPDDLYALVSQQGTGLTDISFSGLTCKTVGSSRAEVDFSATVNSLEISSSSFTDMGACSFNSVAVIKATTFNNCASLDQSGCTFEANNVTISGTITVISGGTFVSNSIISPSGIAGVTTADLDLIGINTFQSDGSSHAVEVTTIGSGSYTWDSEATLYDSGVTGSPVTPTATGNETLYISATTGTVTINVGGSAVVPSIRSAGAIVNVLAGGVTIDINVKDQNNSNISGALVYIDEDLEVVGDIINTTTDVNGNVSTSYTGVGTTAKVRIRLYGYKPYIGTISLLQDSNINITLIADPQQV